MQDDLRKIEKNENDLLNKQKRKNLIGCDIIVN